MKIASIILAMSTLFLLQVPCCIDDDCSDVTGVTHEAHPSESNSNQDCETCLPFVTCGTCTGFVFPVLKKEFFRTDFENHKSDSFYMAQSAQGYADQIWEPPKVG